MNTILDKLSIFTVSLLVLLLLLSLIISRAHLGHKSCYVLILNIAVSQRVNSPTLSHDLLHGFYPDGFL